MSINDLTNTIQGIKDAKEELRGAINAKGGTLADDAKLSEFKDAVEGLPSGGSAFAVDFGEEIATSNPAFIGALQEDIDYYNEFVNRVGNGESIPVIEKNRKLAWYPPNIAYIKQLDYPAVKLKEFRRPTKAYSGYYIFRGCANLIYAEFKALDGDFTQAFMNCGSLRKFKIHNAQPTKAKSMFENCYNLEEIDLDCSNITEATSMITNCTSLKCVNLNFDSLTASSNLFMGVVAEEIKVSLPKIQTLENTFRSCYVDRFYLNIPKVKTNNYSIFYGTTNSNMTICEISGLMVNVTLTCTKVLNVESVKYILDNCQAREDGAPYTLTLHADVKDRFMAKCDEDALYAEALANANTKGLTIA